MRIFFDGQPAPTTSEVCSISGRLILSTEVADSDLEWYRHTVTTVMPGLCQCLPWQRVEELGGPLVREVAHWQKVTGSLTPEGVQRRIEWHQTELAVCQEAIERWRHQTGCLTPEDAKWRLDELKAEKFDRLLPEMERLKDIIARWMEATGCGWPEDVKQVIDRRAKARESPK